MTPEQYAEMLKRLDAATATRDEQSKTLDRIVDVVERTDRDRPGLAMRVDRMERLALTVKWIGITGIGTALTVIYQLQQLIQSWKEHHP